MWDMNPYLSASHLGAWLRSRVLNALCILALLPTYAPRVHAQEMASAQTSGPAATPQSNQELQRRVDQLERDVSDLRKLVRELQSTTVAPQTGQAAMNVAVAVERESPADPAPLPASGSRAQTATPVQTVVSAEDRKTLDYLRGTTIDLGIDGYYAYNFNAPVGRVNLLRAYDVLSNEISLNQASVIFEHAPDVAGGRRWGGRVDLQFGQATDTLQGNPSNEPRPDIYRNIFQVYGSYVAPLGKGLSLDFGKWGSSIGLEGNYTKDQINYSRSYWFTFLPFYHMGVRATYAVNDSLALNYWVVNGTNQVEATNGFKDELFGFTAKPRKAINWTVNYYLGQEHPDRIVVPSASPIPVQPGLSFQAIRPAPDGRLHIFDSYVTWQTTPRLSFALEGDYVIEREWQNAAPGHSSAPSHTDGGAAYAHYQLRPKWALAARAEYLSDRGGLFSGLNQALKESTVTLDYNLAEGFLMRYEWRRDFSNQPSFLTDVQGVLSKQQNTATLGLVWWWGRKQGSW